jgi:hypothetical protein
VAGREANVNVSIRKAAYDGLVVGVPTAQEMAMALPNHFITEYERLREELLKNVGLLEAEKILQAASESEALTSTVTLACAKKILANMERILEGTHELEKEWITNIQILENQSSETLLITNKKNGNYVYCGPPPAGMSTSVRFDEWIPWCASSRDFYDGHNYITLYTSCRAPTYPHNIWQSDERCPAADGDYVRYTTYPTQYKQCADPVPGDPSVNGDRKIVVKPDRSFEFVRI